MKTEQTIQKGTGAFRTESDSIGSREVPVDAYYGVQSMRAAENFPISGTWRTICTTP